MINCLSCGAKCNSDWLHCPSCGGSIQKQLAAAALAQEKVEVPSPVEKPTQPKEKPVVAKKPVKKAKLQLDDYASASEIADKLLAAQVASKIEAKPLQEPKEPKSDFEFREEEMLLDHLIYGSKTHQCKKCMQEFDSAFYTIWLESGFSEEELIALAVLGQGEKVVVGNGFSVTVRYNNNDNTCAHIRTDYASEVQYVVGGTIVSQTNWNPLFMKASEIADALRESGFADEIPTTLSSRKYDANERQQFADDQFRVAHLTGNSKSKSGFQFVLLLSTHSVPLSKGMQHDMSDLGFPAVRVVDDGWHIEIHEEADDLKASLKLAKSIVDSFGGSILSSES
jgi:hypothetical protein